MKAQYTGCSEKIVIFPYKIYYFATSPSQALGLYCFRPYLKFLRLKCTKNSDSWSMIPIKVMIKMVKLTLTDKLKTCNAALHMFFLYNQSKKAFAQKQIFCPPYYYQPTHKEFAT